MREVRIVERRDLDAVLVDEFRMRRIEPAILHRLLLEEGSWIGRGERDLDGVRVDLGVKPDRLLDRHLGRAWQAQDARAVDGDAELVAILGEGASHVDAY